MKKANTDIRVVIADDHELFRDGLKLMLQKAPNISLAGEAENGKDLLQLVEQTSPDVVITDIKMPVMDGVEAAKKMTETYPAISIIALSMFDDDELILEMLEAGAMGYLLKNADKTELIDAINSVYNNKPYYCKQTSGRLARAIANSRHQERNKAKEPVFSDREKEIIVLICQEYTNKDIGEKLFLSPRTVEGYRMKIMEKMNARNTVGVAVAAIRMGIFQPE